MAKTCSVILCCSCYGMEKRAKEAYCILTNGGEVLPDIIKGRDRIFKFAEKTGNEHIKAISKLSGKFAYYICLDDGKITTEYNLLKGRRIA